MKRYFRTKDGKIYDTNRYAYVWTTPRFIGLGISATENILVQKSDLIKEPTDNLDELCDCYLEDGENIPTIIARDKCDGLCKEKALREGNTLYACIIKRDEKGTHIEPFAKLNEKGEMELL